MPQSAPLLGAPGTNAGEADYRANAGARRRRFTTTRVVMRTLSLSLLYVLSMGVFVAAYGLLPLA